MSCPSWQWHRTGSSWSPVQTLPVEPLWCDLGLVQNSRGNKAAANLRPICTKYGCYMLLHRPQHVNMQNISFMDLQICRHMQKKMQITCSNMLKICIKYAKKKMHKISRTSTSTWKICIKYS